jgi:hypothetical protein
MNIVLSFLISDEGETYLKWEIESVMDVNVFTII